MAGPWQINEGRLKWRLDILRSDKLNWFISGNLGVGDIPGPGRSGIKKRLLEAPQSEIRRFDQNFANAGDDCR